MSLNRGMDTENVAHLHNGVLLSYFKKKEKQLNEILRQMDKTIKNQIKLGNPITKRNIWYTLTDMWILAQISDYPRQ